MADPMKRLPWQQTPEEVLERWPDQWPLALSRFLPECNNNEDLDVPADQPPSQVVVLSRPSGRYCCLPEDVACQKPHWTSFDTTPPPVAPQLLTGQPLTDLDLLLSATTNITSPDHTSVPFAGGWIASVAYELCSQLEPTVHPRRHTSGETTWPLLEMLWCPTALVYDQSTKQWWAVGPWAQSALEELGQALTQDVVGDVQSLECLTTNVSLSDQAYEHKVQDILNYIAAGDVFQVNMTQQLEATVTGNPRQLARRVLCEPQAHFGSYLELGMADEQTKMQRWLASLSPELFLSVDPRTRRVRTRPIKGTLPADLPEAELLNSEKDKAELNMIIDLMRNDLGRICTYGSVKVSRERWIETYPTVHHAVGEVIGTLKPDIAPSDLMSATFPPGSVTGAPKVRAMQIIRDLEPKARGPYCGAIGLFGNDGSIVLNVSIRTLWAHGQALRPNGPFHATLYYGAGGGVVADSNPNAEYQESLQKMAVVQDLLTIPEPVETPLAV